MQCPVASPQWIVVSINGGFRYSMHSVRFVVKSAELSIYQCHRTVGITETNGKPLCWVRLKQFPLVVVVVEIDKVLL